MFGLRKLREKLLLWTKLRQPRLSWWPAPQEFLSPLRTMRPSPLYLDRLNRGIDNIHIDVLISPVFAKRLSSLLNRLLLDDVSENYWGEKRNPVGNRDLEIFRNSYSELEEIALEQARKKSQPEIIQLFQLSMVKLFHHAVIQEVNRLRGELQQALERAQKQDMHFRGRELELHDRMVILAKQRHILEHRLLNTIFRYLYDLENNQLRKLRKSMLGISWPISKGLLFNPLLQLSSLRTDEAFMRQYPLFCNEHDICQGFRESNRIIATLFHLYLPEWALPPEQEVSDLEMESTTETTDQSSFMIRQRVDQGKLKGFLEVENLLHQGVKEEEFAHPERYGWLDVPTNFDLIMSPVQSSDDSGQSAQPSQWVDPRWNEFQQQLLKTTQGYLKRLGLFQVVAASYETPRVYRELQQKIPPRLIFHVLSGVVPKRHLDRRLHSSRTTGNEHKILVRRLIAEKRRLQRLSRKQIYSLCTLFLKDVSRLRRDLKLAYLAYQSMDQIRFLSNSEQLQLSRTNYSLHSFLLREELEENQEQSQIRNHVVLKADVRGSTTITMQLLERGLKPATHFSLNFFGPINKLLSVFGATKTFVEGDAIILTIFEYESQSNQRLSVAHACGLARKILGVVELQNAQNATNSLPPLELGIGIVSAEGTPTFLEDKEELRDQEGKTQTWLRQIMISSAINHADRLSSCSSTLRKIFVQKQLQHSRVEVIRPVDSRMLHKPTKDGFLRYNVNGIELDPQGFMRLQSELVLQQIYLDPPSKQSANIYYVGRYPDRNKAIHWLVIRESPVRDWENDAFGKPASSGEMFYEVITDNQLIERIKQAMRDKVRQKGGSEK